MSDRRIMVSAGEVSGDLHGSYLVGELKKLRPDLEFFGAGSGRLAAAGMEIVLDLTRRGTIGIFEALPNILPIYFAFRRLVQLLDTRRPDLLILIDSQGLNMPLAKEAKKRGIKTVYYIAPQEWLWGTAQGTRKVAASIDLIVAIFQKEYESYKKAGANVVYFGHPLIDIVKASSDAKKEIMASLPASSSSNTAPIISLCPGSRTQEIKSLFPILLKSAELIKKEIPNAEFLMPVPSTGIIEEMFPLVHDFHPKAIAGRTYDVLAASDLAICTSGTINLEASLLGIPNIMVYKLSPLTYFIGKYILGIEKKIKYFSMPNILLDNKIIPELVMNKATPENIASEALSILRDNDRRDKMRTSFLTLHDNLGKPGVISRCANAVIGLILPL